MTKGINRRMVFGGLIVMMASIYAGFGSAAFSTVGVFLKPMVAEFGWLRGTTSFAYSAGVLAMGVGGILMGLIADRTSTRTVVLPGTLVMAVGLALLSRVDSLWQFYLLYLLMGLFGSASFFAPMLAMVGRWFPGKVGMALGIATAGQAIFQGFMPFITGLLIVDFGWRGAYNWLAGFALIVMAPLALLIRPPPEFRNPGAVAQAAFEKAFVEIIPKFRVVGTLGFSAIFCCICMSVPVVHVVALAQDQGLTMEDASSIMPVMFVSGFLGRIFFGRLADRIGGVRAHFTASLWQTLMVFWFTQINSLAGFYLIAAIYGFGYAGVMTSLITSSQTLTPPDFRATATGVVTMFGWVGMALGGYLGGLFFDLTGNYTLSYAVAVVGGVINLLILAGFDFSFRSARPTMAPAT